MSGPHETAEPGHGQVTVHDQYGDRLHIRTLPDIDIGLASCPPPRHYGRVTLVLSSQGGVSFDDLAEVCGQLRMIPLSCAEVDAVEVRAVEVTGWSKRFRALGISEAIPAYLLLVSTGQHEGEPLTVEVEEVRT